jgi:uncharacterized protein (TIRG00374 family)
MKRLRAWRWLPYLLFPLLLWWIWKDIPRAQVIHLLQSLEIWQLIFLVGFNLFLVLLFSLRWWLILAALGYRLPYLRLVAIRLASFAVSFITPGPQFGGEPLQVYALTHRERLPNSIALASVVLDKALELLVNFTFLVFGLLFVFTTGLLGDLPAFQLWLISGILFLLPTGYLGLLWLNQRPFTALLEPVSRLGIAPRRLRSWVEASRAAESQAADFCRCQPFSFSLVLIVSLAVWGLILVEFWLTFSFLGLPLTLHQVIFALVAARIAMLLPIPGGLGTVEASQVVALRMLGLDPAFAVGVMLLARARDVSLVGLGLLFAFWLARKTHTDPPMNRVGESISIHQEA